MELAMHKSKYKTFSPNFRATALIFAFITTLVLSACGGGGSGSGGGGSGSGSSGSGSGSGSGSSGSGSGNPPPPLGGGDMNIVAIMLPAPTRLTTAPQAGGSDIPNIEVAGAGSTSSVRALNNGSGIVTFSAGNWFEPKDGKYQRMIVTRDTQAPPGQVVTIPVACMQRGKSAPAPGLRFFSRPKSISGSLQQCQRSCLTRSLSNIQSCVWACESSNPEQTSVKFILQDGCNDGYRINYKYFGFSSNNERVRVWPSNDSHYYTEYYDREYPSNLSCSSGIYKICYGAETGNTNWGVGLDGTKVCRGDCCTRCPTSGSVTSRVRLTCP